MLNLTETSGGVRSGMEQGNWKSRWSIAALEKVDFPADPVGFVSSATTSQSQDPHEDFKANLWHPERRFVAS